MQTKTKVYQFFSVKQLDRIKYLLCFDYFSFKQFKTSKNNLKKYLYNNTYILWCVKN